MADLSFRRQAQGWDFVPTRESRRILKNMRKASNPAQAKRMTYQLMMALVNDVGYLSAVKMRQTLQKGTNEVASRIPPVAFPSRRVRMHGTLTGLLHDTGKLIACLGYNLSNTGGKGKIARANVGPVLTCPAATKIAAHAGTRGTPFIPANQRPSSLPQGRSAGGVGGFDLAMAGRALMGGSAAMARDAESQMIEKQEGGTFSEFGTYHHHGGDATGSSTSEDAGTAWLRERGFDAGGAAVAKQRVRTLAELAWMHETGFRFNLTDRTVNYFFALATEMSSGERDAKGNMRYTGMGRAFANLAFAFQRKVDGGAGLVSVPARPFMQHSVFVVRTALKAYYPELAKHLFRGWVVSGTDAAWWQTLKSDGTDLTQLAKTEARRFLTIGAG